MDIKDFIKHTGRTKVIIGNGFDLHCGIHTSYRDYYCKNWKKYWQIKKLLLDYENSNRQIDFSNKSIQKWNIWDIFFAINSPDNPNVCKQYWCDIEKLMLSSLIASEEIEKYKDKIPLYMHSRIHWPDLWGLIFNKKPTDPRDRFIVEFIEHGMRENDYLVFSYYDFLLQQLNVFEKNFGEFIYYQIHDRYLEKINRGRAFYNRMYMSKVVDTIDELCCGHTAIDIDSFNFSPLYDETNKAPVNHINGSWNRPIFGVDSCFEPSDLRYIFTKTSRRIESKIIENSVTSEVGFSNVIVYGHSLDSADYSYFFPIFDKLKLLDNEARGKLIFAYTIYDQSKEQSIKTELRGQVSKLLFNYAKDKMIPNPNRFLDSISTQQRIIFYEIPLIQEEAYRYQADSFEEDWQKMIKEMDNELSKGLDSIII